MKGTDDTIGVVDGQRTNVSHGLDLGRAGFVLVVRHLDVELTGARLDGVPARQAGREVDVSTQAEVGGVDDLVCARIVEDGLGVNAGFVGEGAEAGDVVVKRDVDLHRFRHQIFQVLEFLQSILALDVVAIRRDHPSHETTQRSDAVPFADADHRGVDVRRSGLEGAVGIRDGTSGIVVKMRLDVTTDHTSQGPDQIVHLPRTGTAHRVGDAHPVDSDLIHDRVDGQKIDQIGPKRVFARESNLDPLGLDEVDDLDGGVGDVGHVFAMRVFPQVGRRANHHISVIVGRSVWARRAVRNRRMKMSCLHSVHAGLDGDSCIVHMTSNVSEDLRHGISPSLNGEFWNGLHFGLETQSADGLTVSS